METLTARIEAAAAGSGSITFVHSNEDDVQVSWAELHEDAKAMAAALQARGVRAGDHVAILGPTSRLLVTALQATWLAGGTIVVLPLPMRLSSIEAFVAQTRARIRQADTAMLLVDRDLAPFVEAEPGDPPVEILDDLASAGSADLFVVPDEDPDRLAILQFTSGSTSEPKGVMLPHRTVCANLDAIVEMTSLTRENDVLVSWLPLYHDMGLIGFMCLPMSTGVDLVLGAPQDFLAAPGSWMEWISTYGGTATAGPNFSWVLATRALKRSSKTLDLSSLRVALNGAEPVDPESVEAFISAAGDHNMAPGAVFPAFGMAEVAIAGTFPIPMTGLVVDTVDRRVLESESYAAPVADDAPSARRLAKLGRPVTGLEIRVVDPSDGRPLADREVGELEIRGTSVTTGYYKNPEATAEMFRDGWLRTGDLAYLVDGELVMCGRIKDVIIVGGRNVYPQDIERAVGEVDGVRTGNVIAFGLPGRQGKEAMVVVAETRLTEVDVARDAVAACVRDAVGLPAKDIVFVAPGSLPKTSSGKLQRSLCRDRYLSEQLQPQGGA